jgi:hypothetical protein
VDDVDRDRVDDADPERGDAAVRGRARVFVAIRAP